MLHAAEGPFDWVFVTFPEPPKSAKVVAHSSVRGTRARPRRRPHLEQTSHSKMPPGRRPGWVRSLDGLFVHVQPVPRRGVGAFRHQGERAPQRLCGTNLDYGVLAVLVAQTAAWIT